MNTNHRYVLSIPLNVKDLNNITECIPWEEVQFEDFEITKEDYDHLLPLFCEFDKPFNIFIDEYEEEVIPASDIPTAIEMANEYAKKATPQVCASTEKLLAALTRANELGKQLALFF